MKEGIPQQFKSPEDEIAFLREQIAEKERELLGRSSEVDATDIETLGKVTLREYGSFTPKTMLADSHELTGVDLSSSVEQVRGARSPVEDVLQLAAEKGIRNALSVVEQLGDAYLIDEVHRRLVEEIRGGRQLQDMKEGVPPWHIMHMTLFEVTLPEIKAAGDREYQLAELVGMMEQLFAGLRTVGSKQSHNHYVIELAVAADSDDIIFYVAVPTEFVSLFEKQTLSLFPHAVLTEQMHDYNVYVEGGHTEMVNVALKKHPVYPLRQHDTLQSDPMAVILNALSKIEKTDGGAAVQFVIRHPQQTYHKQYVDIVKRVEKGMKPKEAIARSTTLGDITSGLGEFIFAKKKTESDVPPEVDQTALELFKQKITADIVEVNIRLAVSAKSSQMTRDIMRDLQSTFNQLALVNSNEFVFNSQSGKRLTHAEKAFSFREFSTKDVLPLTITELATVLHFPANGINSSPQFKQAQGSTAPAQTNMPSEGTLIGHNNHQNSNRPIYVSEKDRMRHFYVVGQTGTGKSVFLKNLIIQDIQRGDGVCMIDPHGTDIEDVLGAIPPERADDVIYFDPSQLDRPIGLNMLEYDPQKPEQKTFVVNELFSIFQKLYGANPESMGPMFEQYFRNATLLVMEDPESGSTLMDIGRVMADARFRRMKLERATNPVVVQFWREIATKAGGEASLENIVPYIVSKFDVFTANDYMRPIIGQQQSAFNFRQVMDERKILLVNLSKGRLGEINANLIGMIIVGKILMAALSRVDNPRMDFAPFYLHIDEFQNVSTPAIASILSEARKYKLSLTMAHQFMAQLDPSIKDAVFGNVGSMAAFRVGYEDAAALESQFSPVFAANDLMNVPNYTALVRMLADGVPAKPFSLATLPPFESDAGNVADMIARSSARYGRPRQEVEQEIAQRYHKEPPAQPISLNSLL